MTAAAEAVFAEAAPRPRASPPCPLCERPARAVFLNRTEIADELMARTPFFARRLGHRFSRNELRDVTESVLGTPAAILRCMRCGVLIRDGAPGEEAFRDDPYDERVLARLHETHVSAFRAKETDYRPLLPAHARVAEVGSYAGGFLSVAAEWGWSAVGADIGRDAVRFCRGRSLDVRCAPLRDCSLGDGSLDAVFVWNCFEQVAEPGALLDDARRILRPAGLLAIRVPDADFYIRCEQEREAGSEPALAVLAYNGLLGWPHRFGYGAVTLRRLVEKHGFTFAGALRRPAVRPLREAMRDWAREEEKAMIGEANQGWIELTFRKLAA